MKSKLKKERGNIFSPTRMWTKSQCPIIEPLYLFWPNQWKNNLTNDLCKQNHDIENTVGIRIANLPINKQHFTVSCFNLLCTWMVARLLNIRLSDRFPWSEYLRQRTLYTREGSTILSLYKFCFHCTKSLIYSWLTTANMVPLPSCV